MSASVERVKNFVAGELVKGVWDEWQEIINPATGETIAEVPKGSEEDVNRAVEAADKAFGEWFETTPRARAEMLLKLANAMEEHAEKLAQLETKNVGKPISLSRGDAVQHRQHPLLRGGVPGDERQGYGKDLSMCSIEDYTVVKHVMARLD